MSSKRMAGRAAGATVVFAGLFVGLPRCFPAVPEDARIAFIETDDGLTRESIPVLSRPEPTPHPAHAAPTVNPAHVPVAVSSPARTPVPASTPAHTPAPASTPAHTPTPASTPAHTPAPAITPTHKPAPASTPAPHQRSAEVKPKPRHSYVVHRHRHYRWRHHKAEAREEQVAAAPARPVHRNWVKRFVIWWNGFADRRLSGIGHVPLHDA